MKIKQYQVLIESWKGNFEFKLQHQVGSKFRIQMMIASLKKNRIQIVTPNWKRRFEFHLKQQVGNEALNSNGNKQVGK